MEGELGGEGCLPHGYQEVKETGRGQHLNILFNDMLQ
jgi:hypothetical protein